MEDKIFISVASYKDPLLFDTLRSAVKNATRPEALVFGVVDQGHHAQHDAIADLPFAKQVRYVFVNAKDTLGACWARSLVQSLYDGEKYYMQIDAHMSFTPGWDSNLRDRHTQLLAREPKPIITTYPHGFSIVDGVVKHDCGLDVDSVLVIRPCKDRVPTESKSAINIQAYHLHSTTAVIGSHIAAGFIFCAGNFVEEVPYDPFMYFHGEEHALSVRAFTKGWCIFHPPMVPLFHMYKQPNTFHDSHHWAGEVNNQRSHNHVYLTNRSDERLNRLLRGDGLPGAYGLGTVRSIEDFYVVSGINYRTNTVVDVFNGRLSP